MLNEGAGTEQHTRHIMLKLVRGAAGHPSSRRSIEELLTVALELLQVDNAENSILCNDIVARAVRAFPYVRTSH